MTLRPDERLLDTPMLPVQCRRCGAGVEIRKSSWFQTSIQWHDDDRSMRRCAERPSSRDTDGVTWVGCASLRESIQQAVADGLVPVPADGVPE